MPMIVNRQVPMARTPGHQENNNFAAVSINWTKTTKFDFADFELVSG